MQATGRIDDSDMLMAKINDANASKVARLKFELMKAVFERTSCRMHLIKIERHGKGVHRSSHRRPQICMALCDVIDIPPKP